TNHLDLEAREALVEAINEFAGAVVLVSHDWHLLSLTADRLWLVADGAVKPFDGDLEDYRRMVLAPVANDAEASKAANNQRPQTPRGRRRPPPRVRAVAPAAQRSRTGGW